MKNDYNPLKIKNFKNIDGSFIDKKDMDKDKKVAFILAILMQKVIQNLEIAVPIHPEEDRIFKRAKYNTMSYFNEAYSELKEIEKGL